MTGSIQKNLVNKLLDHYIEPVAFIVLFFLIINGGGWLQIYNSIVPKVINDLILWILVFVLFFWITHKKETSFVDFLIWKKNWILFGYLIFAIVSLVWSEYFLIAFYRVFILVACTIVAAFIGINYPIIILFRKLTWFYIVVIALSYFLALFYPAIGTHIGRLYDGAWRGFFFHKNILGIMMSLGSAVFLFKFFIDGKKLKTVLLNISLYLLATGLVFTSKSAAGIITFIILNLTSLALFAWIKLNKKLKKMHYIIFGNIFAFIIFICLSNIGFLLGLINRNTSLTGRVPLWTFLLNYGFSSHPIMGGGYGSPWANDQLRMAIQNAIGWGFAPNTAHNGYVDVFLHFGLIGVVLLVTTLLLYILRAIKYALKEGSFISVFPIIIILFLITVNISESFFLEMESFGWFLMVYFLFATTKIKQEKLNDFKNINEISAKILLP